MVYQVSAILNLDKKDVSRVEVYYCTKEFGGERTVFETLTDSKSLDLLIELAQKDFLEDPTKFLGEKFCGIYFYNKAREIVADQEITSDSSYYDDFVKEVPKIKEY